MCVNRRWITTKTGHKLCVNCGHCPACLQEKAMKRASRIKNHLPDDGSRLFLFVTLTYRNHCIPYIDLDEISKQPSYYNHLIAQNVSIDRKFHGDDFKVVNVYRNCSDDLFFDSNSNTVKHRVIHKREIISKVPIYVRDLQKDIDNHSFKFLQNQKYKRVGVSFYPDVQNFIKRLRINLFRDGFNDSIDFFCCSEYGPTTGRPHFHLLISCPSSDYKLVQRAIGKAWTYDNHRKAFESCEIARNAASYVSSYVNCDASVPFIFKDVKEFRPHHTMSKGLGLGKKYLSLEEIRKALSSGDLHYLRRIVVGESSVDVPMLYPRYSVNRYFPKIKGYNRLTSDEVISICIEPERLFSQQFKYKLGYNQEDAHLNYAVLNAAIRRYCSIGLSKYDFAFDYSRVWSLYYSNLLGDLYNSIDVPIKNFFAYDNIKDYYSSSVISPSLDVVFANTNLQHFEEDFNKFPEFVNKTNYYAAMYEYYSKDKKIRNMAYSSNNLNI